MMTQKETLFTSCKLKKDISDISVTKLKKRYIRYISHFLFRRRCQTTNIYDWGVAPINCKFCIIVKSLYVQIGNWCKVSVRGTFVAYRAGLNTTWPDTKGGRGHNFHQTNKSCRMYCLYVSKLRVLDYQRSFHLFFVVLWGLVFVFDDLHWTFHECREE